MLPVRQIIPVLSLLSKPVQASRHSTSFYFLALPVAMACCCTLAQHKCFYQKRFHLPAVCTNLATPDLAIASWQGEAQEALLLPSFLLRPLPFTNRTLLRIPHAQRRTISPPPPDLPPPAQPPPSRPQRAMWDPPSPSLSPAVRHWHHCVCRLMREVGRSKGRLSTAKGLQL